MTCCSGKKLAITAKGTLHEKVEEGAKVNLQVKYGLITLIRQTADLCEYVKEVDLECPLDKGDLKLYKEVDLPKEIPPVSVAQSVQTDLQDADPARRASTASLPTLSPRTTTPSPASRPPLSSLDSRALCITSKKHCLKTQRSCCQRPSLDSSC